MVAINNNAQPTAEASYDQPVVGLILPPPEIRSIVDKTASFVARNGEQFEQKIKQEIVSTFFSMRLPLRKIITVLTKYYIIS